MEASAVRCNYSTDPGNTGQEEGGAALSSLSGPIPSEP